MPEKANFSKFWPNLQNFQKKIKKIWNFNSTAMRPNVWWKISFDKSWPKHGQICSIWPKYWPKLVIIIISKSLSGFYSLWLTESQLWAEKVNAVKNNQNNSVFSKHFYNLNLITFYSRTYKWGASQVKVMVMYYTVNHQARLGTSRFH